jgi:ribosomal protein S18 acetylase RimI-like enzyme
VSLDPTIRRRLLEFEIGLDERCCDEVVETDWGKTFLTPSLPLVWDASWIAIEETGVGAREAAALAEDMLGGAGFAHRTVVPLEEADGRRLVGEAGELPGWEVELVDYMVWEEESGRRPSAEVREAPLAEIATLRTGLIHEFLPASEADPEATGAQLLELDGRLGEAGGDRWFVAPVEEPAAACRLLAGERIGQVEDVGTLAPARDQGLAQAVALTALAQSRAAGHELTFLSADAEDWPRLMYEKLGFRKVGEVHVLRRRPT